MLMPGTLQELLGSTLCYITPEWRRLTFVSAPASGTDYTTVSLDDCRLPSEFYVDDIVVRPQW